MQRGTAKYGAGKTEPESKLTQVTGGGSWREGRAEGGGQEGKKRQHRRSGERYAVDVRNDGNREGRRRRQRCNGAASGSIIDIRVEVHQDKMVGGGYVVAKVVAAAYAGMMGSGTEVKQNKSAAMAGGNT